ncbi:L,D-transpeptidase family protein [Streptomyces albipurpureus]|uniref:L,D-transpeptidase n=1 Tax=Streptomyces albipurpureus TaxID=2897419 RepID=A0ABT0UEV3_9ACTN|nr:L,D-transpeptidase [Streptomyces sp. CWNU-1]MCM2386716.1 L,D-transpeptidase [Streptomyces sp. CWNU-1]
MPQPLISLGAKRHRADRRRSARVTRAAVLCGLAAALLVGAGASPAVSAVGGRLGAVECSTQAGPYQAVVERHLGLAADGVQTPADCAAVQRLQERNGLVPASGYAGVETWRMVQYEEARADPASLTGCPRDVTLVVCIDLARQVLWVWDGRRVVFGPVPVRTGSGEFPTRTGRQRIYERVEEQWSDLYDAPMPFSQFFNGGQALHASYRTIWEEPGSHGCVNLRYDDAERLWNGLRLGDTVYAWGTRTA